MTDVVLEFVNVSMEHIGHLNPGRIKFTDQNVVFKTTKSGRLEQLAANDIDTVEWIRLAGKPAVRVLMKNGHCYRFGGFTDQDYDKMRAFVNHNWKKDFEKVEQCPKGWNYGMSKFEGSMMRFEVEKENCFEVPLENVNNCTSTKNEITLEFHQNDECLVSLMEIRFHIPTADNISDDMVEEFRKNVMRSAGIIQETGRSLAVLDQVLCTTPRGRYDIKLYPTFLALHGKTFDYKIPISTILRLFLLPHKDGRRMYFVISLDPPIKQGQTRYHFLILEFLKDEEIELELGLSDEALNERFEGQLSKQMKGPLYEVVSRIMKTLVKKRITVPGTFIGHSGTPAISCALKQSAGFLYPLEKGFMYVHKPPLHIRSEEIACVNFARSDVSTRSFDFEIETKSGSTHTFTSIEKEEYNKLYDFVNGKHLRIRNVTKSSTNVSAKEDFFEGSDEEGAGRDHYAEKLKNEAREREDLANNEESDESEDSDYNPGQDKAGSEEPDEEYDSDVKGSSSDGESDGGSKKATKPKAKRKHETSSEDDTRKKSAVKKRKDAKTESGGGGGKGKRKKDPGAPKKFLTSYLFWFNENREKIKKEEPGLTIGQIAKKGGELWKKVTDRSKWEQMAEKDKERYQREMEEYRKSGGASTSTQSKTPVKSKKSTPTKKAKSKEFVQNSESSSEEEEPSKKSESSDEDELSSSASGSGSEAD